MKRLPLLTLVYLIFGFAWLSAGEREDALTILVSIDGARWDYPELHDNAYLRALAAEGVRVRELRSSFPSKTFPNHYTLATGLHPGHHGIINNSFEKPETGERFRIGEGSVAARTGHWWGGEPIWVTAERQGVHAFCFFWPGSEAEIGGYRPSRYRIYDHDLPHSERIDQVVEWARLPPAERPGLITLYFAAVDSAGHRYGPDAAEIRAALDDVTAALADLQARLEAAGVWRQTNLLSTSDHGMTPIRPEKTVALDEHIDLTDVRIDFLGEVGGLWVKQGEPEAIVERLNAAGRCGPSPARACPSATPTRSIHSFPMSFCSPISAARSPPGRDKAAAAGPAVALTATTPPGPT